MTGRAVDLGGDGGCYSDWEGCGPWRRRGRQRTLAAKGSSEDGEGGNGERRRSSTATATAADLGVNGEQLRRGGRGTLAATGSCRSGGDGESECPLRRWGAAMMGMAEDEEGWRSYCSPNNTWSARWNECACARSTWQGACAAPPSRTERRSARRDLATQRLGFGLCGTLCALRAVQNADGASGARWDRPAG